MLNYATAISWLVLSPVAIFTDVIAIVFVCHYKPFYHGSDVIVVSLLVAMTMNALLVVPIPVFVDFNYIKWNDLLCKFYVWSFLTFRFAQMLSLSAICFHWTSIFRASSKNQNKGLTYKIKIISVIIWILSTIVGLLPIIGAVSDDFFDNGSCNFLSSDIGIGFTVFMFIFVVTCMFSAIISICDVTFLTRCMTKNAHIKYRAGRFYLPKKRVEIPGDGHCNTQEKIYQLNFTWDLCRLFCVVISFCFIGNHLPFAILEFMQSVTNFNRRLVQEIILWLVLIEALIFPNLLWSCSRRYRHAMIYTWKVHIMRRPREEEEDPFSCRLQSYSRKVRDINGHTNSVIESPATQRPATINPDDVDAQPQDTPDIVLEPINNGKFKYNRTDSRSPNHHPETEKETSFTTFYTVETQVHTHPDHKLDANTSSSSVERAHSGSSRQEWKAQMRKKHLPPFFTNDSFTAEVESTNVQEEEQIVRSDGNSGSVHSLYYLSGAYHPDFLNTDSLPRHQILGLENAKDVASLRLSTECDDIDTSLRSPEMCNEGGKDSYPSNIYRDVPKSDLSPCKSMPVSADEIDIYIYQEASNTNSQLSSNRSISGKQGQYSTYPNINDVREPAEGCNEEDEKQNYNDRQTPNSPNQNPEHVSSNWTDIVEPILKQNEKDELDVSLTSCDPTWQQVKQYKQDRSRLASFDQETDRGFEEALSVEYEEYERSISSMTNESIGDSIDALNPFDLDNDFKNESFKTQAVVSKSRPASCSTVESDNPFDYVPIETRRDVIQRSFSDNGNTHKPLFSTFKSSFTNSSNSNSSHDVFGDAFGSDLSNGKTSTPNNNSPWPTILEQSPDDENAFESDFANGNVLSDSKQQNIDKVNNDPTPDDRGAPTRSDLNEESTGFIMDVAPVLL